mmetsp:Transcript_65040/g.172220  ORF Transcript_65040/g.172220 Transcript_65040/m.172220 type:complete len:208 (-) Transcript_65040:839-1462(-)
MPSSSTWHCPATEQQPHQKDPLGAAPPDPCTRAQLCHGLLRPPRVPPLQSPKHRAHPQQSVASKLTLDLKHSDVPAPALACKLASVLRTPVPSSDHAASRASTWRSCQTSRGVASKRARRDGGVHQSLSQSTHDLRSPATPSPRAHRKHECSLPVQQSWPVLGTHPTNLESQAQDPRWQLGQASRAPVTEPHLQPQYSQSSWAGTFR